MRRFTDQAGRTWLAVVREEPGIDYKGRFYLAFTPEGGPEDEVYPLEDVRWNTERTGLRTIETMSQFELRRRLAWALQRGPGMPIGR